MVFKKRKPKLLPETIEKIIKLPHEEFLEAGEISKMLSLPERDVAAVINPHF